MQTLRHNLHPGADGDKIVELDHVGVAETNASGTRGGADEILAIGSVDVDIAILAGAVVGLFAVKPEDAGEDEVLFLDWVGGFPDTARGFASNKVGSGFGMIADLLADTVPTEGSLIAIRFRTGSFFSGGDRKRAGEGAILRDDVETLGRDGDAKLHWWLV